MQANSDFGIHRCLEPINSFPDSAWKLDNTMEIQENEILIEVKLLNVDSNSFKQIYVECGGDEKKIAGKIMDIVSTRGKLHNPVTGTGGILYGKVMKMGKSYSNIYSLNVGDEIISLTSLALTPLKINSILNVDKKTGQIEISGKAILFEYSPLLKVPEKLPLKLLLAVLDEAGAPIQSYNLAMPGNTVIIMGASGETGLMCAYAVRKKISKNGRLIGIRSPKGDSHFKDELTEIFDEVYNLDVFKPLESFEILKKQEKLADLTVNCINSSGTEMLTILCTNEYGTIYLSSLGTNYKTMCLSAEGIAKDINIIAYKGYSNDHANFTIKLLEDNPKLVDLLNKRLERNYAQNSISNQLAANTDIEANILKDISLEEYVFASNEMQKVLDNALKVANYDCTVLITGESGVGKEIIATIVHKGSDRNYLPSIKINCGSIPKNLLESELFGYEKGAFTGADKKGKLGFFELAKGGTLFLDEIGELPLDLQVKLLRALQEKEIYRVGGTTPVKVDVRIIAATNKDLAKLVDNGLFREDLYYRLNVFPILIPPLRSRRHDIVPLIMHFCKHYNQKFKLNKTFNQSALNCLADYDWPGNIRELENIVQRLLITSDKNIISITDVVKILGTANNTNLDAISNELNIENNTLEEILQIKEYELLKSAKEKYKTTRKIAKALGLSQSTLVRKLNKYKL